MKKYIIVLSAITGMLHGCGRFGNEDKKKHLDIRIISAAKQYTEIIYALGADSNLVAVDISSVYPPEVKKLPTIGYHMKLSFEGVMATKPTLLLHHGGYYSIGPEHVVRQLEKLKIPMKTFNNKATDITTTKQLIKEMGVYFNKNGRAEELCVQLDADMQKALRHRNQINDTVKVVVMHFGQAMNMYLAVGRNSTAGQLIEWAGGRIPIEKKGMERITSPELIAQADPDVILLTDFGYDRLGSPGEILELPGVALTRAAKNNRIYRVEAHDLIYFGPRTGQNVLKLQSLIHQKPPL
jgi:iron complex transport system substrate-binding protein